MTRQVGRYQLIRRLAVGDATEVFLARDSEKTLVLRCLLPGVAYDSDVVREFLTRARLIARLTHPHIVRIFEIGEPDGECFLAMEYIDGPSLHTLIQDTSAQGRALPPELCARLVSQACEGMAFMHDFRDPETGEAREFIHCGLRTDKLLLSRQGEVKVLGFGIDKEVGPTRVVNPSALKRRLIHSPLEQLRGQPLDRRVDVYALGLVLYELLTGREPYASESDADLPGAVFYGRLVPAARLRPELPPRLSDILERALAKDREQRYPDCHAFQADLEEFIASGGKPVTARQVAQLTVQAASRSEPSEAPPAMEKSQAQDPTPSSLSGLKRHWRWMFWWVVPLAAGLFIAVGALVIMRLLPEKHTQAAPPRGIPMLSH